VVLDKDSGSWFIVDSSWVSYDEVGTWGIRSTPCGTEEAALEEQVGAEEGIWSVATDDEAGVLGYRHGGNPDDNSPASCASCSALPWPMGSAALGWTGFRGKTLWDVLQLLIVPFALAVIGILFTIQQNARQEQIENQRAKVDREIEDTRAEQALLQSYLDQMGALLLDRNLRAADEDSNVRNVARARTLTTLAALNDPRRKQKALRFFKVLGRDAVNTGQPTEWRAGYQPQLRGVARC
jgi:hypothetical protein